MRQWVFALVTLMSVGCGGSVDADPSPLHKLCMDACAHVHARNCLEAPAVDVANCENECINVQSLASSPCTDEQAALYACTAKATIQCASVSGIPPTIIGCDTEQEGVNSCQTPGLTCLRSPSSDVTCFDFGFMRFFVCSEGISPDPKCIQVSSDGFCCP